MFESYIWSIIGIIIVVCAFHTPQTCFVSLCVVLIRRENETIFFYVVTTIKGERGRVNRRSRPVGGCAAARDKILHALFVQSVFFFGGDSDFDGLPKLWHVCTIVHWEREHRQLREAQLIGMLVYLLLP